MLEFKDKKVVAWGANKLLQFYVRNTPQHKVSYIVDSNKELQGKRCAGLEVRSPDEIKIENLNSTIIILFPVSHTAIQSILGELHTRGFILNTNVFLYADVFYASFERKFKSVLKQDVRRPLYDFVKAFSLSTKVPIHTTLLGNMLFLELLDAMRNENMNIAEVGAYHGGNALIALLHLAGQLKRPPFYIFDSFEGFPDLSAFDPHHKKKGDYKIEGTFENIRDTLSIFPNARVIKGFVPETFSQLPKNAQYGLVFYDCDLYEPALSTFKYFWDRIIPGGFLMIHDYVAEEGGFTGVKQATDEFFKGKDVTINVFWENTSAVVVKK